MDIFGDKQLSSVILDVLVSGGHLESRQAQIALAAENTYEDVCRHVSHAVIASAISEISGDRLLTDVDAELDIEVRDKYSSELSKSNAFALYESDNKLTVAVVTTLDDNYLRMVESRVKDVNKHIKIEYVIVPQDVIKQHTTRLDMNVADGNAEKLLQSLSNMNDEDASGSTWLETHGGRTLLALFKECVSQGVSDIHIRPRSPRESDIRYRIDGDMSDWYVVPSVVHGRLAAIIKTAAKLDASSHNSITQDGSIKLDEELGVKVTIRVNILPSMYDERIVMRIIDSSSAEGVSLGDLGFLDSELTEIRRGLKYTSGLILVTGPTSSGKNTTMYGMLQELRDPRKTFISVEDPIEGIMSFVDQVEVDNMGLTFSSALRSILRQDPDVIMVTEIRDNETAEISAKAAMTGHAVLTTLHTNSSTDTILRITKMGIDNLDVARSVNLLVAQRLAKGLCKHCKVSVAGTPENILKYLPMLDEDVIEEYQLAGDPFYITNKKGCSQCKRKGYAGRCVVPEVVFVDSVYSDYLLKMDLGGFEKRLRVQKKDMLSAALKRSRMGLVGLDMVAGVLSK